jgi:hypothetical protein
MEDRESLAMTFLAAVQSGDMSGLRPYYAEDVVFDGTVPRWHFSIQGVDPVLEQLADWWPSRGELSDVRATTGEGRLVIEFERRWVQPVENGMHPELVCIRQVHILEMSGGHVVDHCAHCAGVWDSATMAQIAAEAPSVEHTEIAGIV